MSYEIGTLTSHGNFLDKLVAFLTSTDCNFELLDDTDTTSSTSADLATIGTSGNVTLGRVVYLKSTGLAYDKSIIYCFWEVKNTVAGYWNIGFHVGYSYNPLLTKENQAGVSPPHWICMTDDPATPYWFFANNQRVIFLVSSASGTYRDAGYIGCFTPVISTSDDMPLPLCIGGSAISSTKKYTDSRSAFFAASSTNTDLGLASANDSHNLSVRAVGGGWIKVGDTGYESYLLHRAQYVLASVEVTKCYSSGSMEKVIEPITMASRRSGFKGIYGELDGVFYVNGNGLDPQDTLTIGGSTYLCWNNINSASSQNFCAIKLV